MNKELKELPLKVIFIVENHSAQSFDKCDLNLLNIRVLAFLIVKKKCKVVIAHIQIYARLFERASSRNNKFQERKLMTRYRRENPKNYPTIIKVKVKN